MEKYQQSPTGLSILPEQVNHSKEPITNAFIEVLNKRFWPNSDKINKKNMIEINIQEKNKDTVSRKYDVNLIKIINKKVVMT